MTDRVDAHSLKRRLLAALALNAVIVGAEAAIGFRVHSVGLLSDAGHNLIDQGGLFLTLYAHLLCLRPASATRTFGYHRAGIVAALLNAFMLLLTASGLAAMACWRLLTPMPVAGGWMAAAAFVSFFANLGIALLLRRDSDHDLNIRSAFWHMLGDAWVSFGVVASGAAIMLTRWYFLDPLISLVIVAVVIKGAWNIFRESLDILMETTPPDLKLEALIEELRAIPGVIDVHDVHAWTIKPGMSMLSCHLTIPEAGTESRERLVHEARKRAFSIFKIQHATVQVETNCCHADELHCDIDRTCGMSATDALTTRRPAIRFEH